MRAEMSMTITSTAFGTEGGYDFIRIGGTSYSGSTGPMNVQVAAGTIVTWEADYSVVGMGFTICALFSPPSPPPPYPPGMAPLPMPPAMPPPPSPPSIPSNCVGPGADLIVDVDALRNSLSSQFLTSQDPCTVAEGCFTGLGRRRVLRFDTTIANIGCEDYHIGSPPADTRVSGRGWNWHECHNHWHYENYAHYWIEPLCLAEQSIDHPVYAGHKNGWCVMDIGAYQDFYPPGGSPGSPGCHRGCGNQGISAGCYDTYHSGLDCQWIDITSVPPGVYTLAVATNWETQHERRRHPSSTTQTMLRACPSASP